MALPTLIKTHTISACNRVVFTSAAQCFQDEFIGFKNFLKTNGATVKGSSNGTVAAMDAVDRIVVGADWNVRGAGTGNAQSWIVLTLPGMSCEVLFCYQGGTTNGMKVAFSQAAGWVVAGTATFQPTATDEVIVMAAASSLDGGAASLDRLWSAWITTDGTQINWAIARNGSWVHWLRISKIDGAAIGTPAAWNNPIIGFRLSAFAHSNLFTTAATHARIDGGSGYVDVTAYVGCEGYNNGTVPAKVTGSTKLQGNSGKMFTPLAIWSETVNADGKVGNMIDMWAGVVSAADGTTYPNDSSRQFIHIGNFIVPWNGAVVAMS